ncbi:MAG: YfcC family protein [Bacteroidales bacterium]|nr:YfcC family protein [Bacteroidales bacterium]
MRKGHFPNTYVIISAIILVCALATFFVTPGQYVTTDDGSVVYETVGRSPQSWQVFSALYDGFVKQAGIIAFILIVGGAFWVLNATGAVAYGINRFISRAGKYDRLVLAGLALLFSVGGAVFGMSEETIPFVGIVVPLVTAMGYDAITGLLVVYVASNIGFSSAFLNPFTVGIAQEMSGLPLFSGMGYRLVCWAVLTVALIVFILWYARNIRREPSEAAPVQAAPAPGASRRHAAILAVLLLTVVLLIVGVTCFKWYMAEISALFLVMGIAAGIIGGFSANRIADEFIAGAKDILSAALVVGLASGIIVILQNGHVVDSILHGLESGLGDAGKAGSLGLMYGIQTVINLLIPSATAKAAVTIPIMAPFCDLIHLSRQSMVMAFQFGDGFTNMLTPTSGVLMAALAMARVPYEKWLKWVWKYVLVLIVAGFVLLLPTVFMPLAGF